MKYMKNPLLWGGIGIATLAGIWWVKKDKTIESVSNTTQQEVSMPNFISGFIFGMNPKETDIYYEYIGKSLNPGYGISDLNITAREEIKGLQNCAKWCNDNEDCEAFTHWWKHPNEEIKDTCHYWSSNQHETETYELPSNALGPSDEGKGVGHRVNSYIKKSSSGYAAENRIKLTCQSHHAF